jgi:hypothetical protein
VELHASMTSSEVFINFPLENSAMADSKNRIKLENDGREREIERSALSDKIYIHWNRLKFPIASVLNWIF